MRLDEAAAALIEMRNASGVLHLLHPRPIPWRMVLDEFSRETGTPLVPWDEWMARLTTTPEDVPALRILEFWRNLGPAGLSGMSEIECVETVRAQKVSPTLRSMAPLSRADSGKWMAYWKRAGVVELLT